MQFLPDEMQSHFLVFFTFICYFIRVKTINTSFERFLLRLNQGWIYGYKRIIWKG